MRMLALLFLLMPSILLAAEEVVLGLSKDKVAITADFDGSDILIFGAVKREEPIKDGPPLEVIITVSGPIDPLVVRKKEKRFGIWINTQSLILDEAPAFYAVATSAPFSQTLTGFEDMRHKVSVRRAIRSITAPAQAKTLEFTDAIIRIREKSGLYQQLENTVQVDQQTLFRTSIKMPSNVPEGDYVVRILLTRDSKLVSQLETVIDVSKVGLERWLFSLSRQHPLMYGLLSLTIAVIAGWAASAIFRPR